MMFFINVFEKPQEQKDKIEIEIKQEEIKKFKKK